MLTTPAIEAVLNNELYEHIQDLKDTAGGYSTCVGLASNQIWNKPTPPPRVFILLMNNGEWKEFINPIILKATGTKFSTKEGCLSLPNKLVKHRRSSNLRIKYLDQNGKLHEEIWYYSALMPVVAFQHEYDHLNGVMESGS